MTMGATIVGFLVIAISFERVGRLRALWWGLAGCIVGGAFGCASDAASDALWVTILRKQPAWHMMGFLPEISWNLTVALSMAAAIVLCTQPTSARVSRGLLAGIGAGIAGFACRLILTPITLIVLLFMMESRGPKGVTSGWIPFDPSRLGDFISMGIVLGLAFGLTESLLATGRLRHVMGRNEGRTYLLGKGLNRIGSAEGIEVPIFGDRKIDPVHATIHSQDGQLSISNVSMRAGTLVNGIPVQSSLLRVGDQVTVGSQLLVVERPGKGQPVIVYPAPYTPPPAASIPESTPSFYHILTDSFGQVIVLPEGAATIGRAAEATISIPHESSVSRIHARITVTGATAFVEDMQSRNGTTVNGNSVLGKHKLVSGDTIQFGREKMKYRVSS